VILELSAETLKGIGHLETRVG
jgi:hypothetical protein